MDGRDSVTAAELRAAVVELELRLRSWIEEHFRTLATRSDVETTNRRFEAWCKRLDEKPIDEIRIREIANRALLETSKEHWTGWSRVITVVLFLATLATVVINLILLLTQ
jgi:hypothetical protein